MTLAEYLRRHGLSDAEFAERAGGMTRSEVWAYRTRRRVPRAGHVALIEAATREQVKARDLHNGE